MKHKHFLSVLIAVFFMTVPSPPTSATDPKPRGVCETFTRNPEIITHSDRHPVKDFADLAQLSAKVVDGDTIAVTGKRGNKYKVRFVAAFAPEIGEKGDAEATDFVQKHIDAADGKVVLFQDGPRATDKYGRQLRLVCVVNPDGELVCLDELLVRNGLAEATYGDKFYYSSRPYFKQITPKKRPDDPDFPKYDLKYLEHVKKAPR